MKNRTTGKSLEGLEGTEKLKGLVVATGVHWSPRRFAYDAAYKSPEGEVGLWRRCSRGAGSDSTVDEAEASHAEGWDFHSLNESYPPMGDDPGYCATDWRDMPEWLVPFAIDDVLQYINRAARVFNGDIAELLLYRMYKEGYRFHIDYDFYEREGGEMTMWKVEGGEKSHVFVHKKARWVVFADTSAEAIKLFTNDKTVVDGFGVDWTGRIDHKKAVELPVVSRPKNEGPGNIFIAHDDTVYLAKSYEDLNL